MAYAVEALVHQLESKICYHREAKLHYMEIKAMVDELVQENKKLEDEKMEFMSMIDSVVQEKEKWEHDYEAIKAKVAPMEEQLETVKKELAAAKHELVAAKEQLVAEKNVNVTAKEEVVVARKQLVAEKQDNVAAKEELVQKNKELEVLRKKLQKSEAMHTQLQQQIREPLHFGRVTRSTCKREMPLQGSLLNDANRLKKPKSYPQLPTAIQSTSQGDDLEVLRQMLIKGFAEIDAGRHLGLKEMGKLNEKPFMDACAMKLPPSQSCVRASELYTLWQELLNNTNWKPFKTVKVDGNSQEEEVIDVDDEKLQGLKMAWGEGPYNSVIRALVERKEHNCDWIVDIWNYKEGRKATIGELVEHILDIVTCRSRRDNVCG